MTNYNDNTDDLPAKGIGGSKGFKPYMHKARLAYSLLPEQKVFMRQKAGGQANKLMRARTLADYGLNVDPKSTRNRYGI